MPERVQTRTAHRAHVAALCGAAINISSPAAATAASAREEGAAVKGTQTGKGRPQAVRLNTKSACLHKRLPTVFTASAHFCFTASKLLRRLFCFT